MIDFELPITVKLTVVDVDPGVKGDTAQGNHLLFSTLNNWTGSPGRGFQRHTRFMPSNYFFFL